MHVDFEERFGAALRGTADAFTPGDAPALVAAGYARGRRLRRRRTAGVVAGAVAVVLVAAGGVAAGTVLAHPGGRDGVAPPAATPRRAVTAEQMSAALSSLLLPDPFMNVTGRSPGAGGRPPVAQAYAVFQEEAHSYEIGVSLGRPAPRAGTCPSPSPPVSCEVIPVQGGTLVVTANPAFAAGGSQDAVLISVWFRTDRYAVAVELRGPRTSTPDDLPVSQAHLVRIALAGVWGELAAALPPSNSATLPPPGLGPAL